GGKMPGEIAPLQRTLNGLLGDPLQFRFVSQISEGGEDQAKSDGASRGPGPPVVDAAGEPRTWRNRRGPIEQHGHHEHFRSEQDGQHDHARREFPAGDPRWAPLRYYGIAQVSPAYSNRSRISDNSRATRFRNCAGATI